MIDRTIIGAHGVRKGLMLTWISALQRMTDLSCNHLYIAALSGNEACGCTAS